MTTSQYANLVQLIVEETGGEFGPAQTKDLAHLVNFGLPPSIVNFFVTYEPLECIEGAARLWPISHLVVENTEAVPGCNIIKHGYVVFSTTYCGDAYCFDLNCQLVEDEPRVILMCCEEDFGAKTAEEVHNYAIPVAANLWEFLEMFALEQLKH